MWLLAENQMSPGEKGLRPLLANLESIGFRVEGGLPIHFSQWFIKPLSMRPVHIGGWGVLNREIVSFRSCVRTRGLVA